MVARTLFARDVQMTVRVFLSDCNAHFVRHLSRTVVYPFELLYKKLTVSSDIDTNDTDL